MSFFKNGIDADYDLMANAEPSAKGNTCVVCEKPATYQWSDYSGEGMCRHCGTPYQLKWGSEKQEAEGAYPYLNLQERWVPIVREYHRETGAFVCLGMVLGDARGREEFDEWVTKHYPEMLRDEEVTP